MRRLAVCLMVGALAVATVLAPGGAWAQSPEQEQTLARVENRDLTLYAIGLGAIMGVIAFNIAAPPVASWGQVAGQSLRNLTAVAAATRAHVAARLAGRAVPVAAVRAATVVAAAPAAAPAAAAAVGAAAGAARPVVATTVRAAGGMMVPPLTQSMLAQAQIAATAAAAVGASVVYYGYRLFYDMAGWAP
jgi:hypothetical protein